MKAVIGILLMASALGAAAVEPRPQEADTSLFHAFFRPVRYQRDGATGGWVMADESGGVWRARPERDGWTLVDPEGRATRLRQAAQGVRVEGSTPSRSGSLVRTREGWTGDVGGARRHVERDPARGYRREGPGEGLAARFDAAYEKGERR